MFATIRRAAVALFAATVRPLGRRLVATLASSLVATWILFACIAYVSYVAEWQAAGLFTNNINALVAVDIARNVELYDLSLKAAAADVMDAEIWALPAHIRQKALFDKSANASGLGSIIIFDRAGDLVVDSRHQHPAAYSAADDTFFRAHLDMKRPDGLEVSHPFRSPLHADEWIIALSRRIKDTDGSFAGVVVGSVKLSYFLHLFDAVAMPAGSAITLLHEDGTILVRSHLADIGRDVGHSPVLSTFVRERSGVLTTHSTIDGVERLYAFAPIDRLPVLLITGIATRELRARWLWHLALFAVGSVVLSGLIIFLAVTLGRELHRRILAEEALMHRAATDGLTELANRRHFDEFMHREWNRALRDGSTLALLMIDGDFFKSYNDANGHLHGDKVLRAIADVLRGAVRRSSDLVARFGGEEFTALLPATDLEGALGMAETVRSAVAALALPHPKSPFGIVTVSIGLAACRPATGGTALTLIEEADRALYRAKARGRNQIAIEVDAADLVWQDAG